MMKRESCLGERSSTDARGEPAKIIASAAFISDRFQEHSDGGQLAAAAELPEVQEGSRTQLRQQLVAGEPQQDGVVERHRSRGARVSVESGEFTDHLARADD